MSFSLAHVCVCVLSPTLFATSWTVACQASQSTGCLRQEYRKVKVKVKIDQSCLTLCDPTDHTVHGILQARILEKVAVPFSRRSSQPRDWTQVSCIAGGFFTSWVTREAQEYWSELPFPFQGIFPTQGSNPSLLRLLHCRQILYHWAAREARGLFRNAWLTSKYLGDFLFFKGEFLHNFLLLTSSLILLW